MSIESVEISKMETPTPEVPFETAKLPGPVVQILEAFNPKDGDIGRNLQQISDFLSERDFSKICWDTEEVGDMLATFSSSILCSVFQDYGDQSHDLILALRGFRSSSTSRSDISPPEQKRVELCMLIRELSLCSMIAPNSRYRDTLRYKMCLALLRDIPRHIDRGNSSIVSPNSEDEFSTLISPAGSSMDYYCHIKSRTFEYYHHVTPSQRLCIETGQTVQSVEVEGCGFNSPLLRLISFQYPLSLSLILSRMGTGHSVRELWTGLQLIQLPGSTVLNLDTLTCSTRALKFHNSELRITTSLYPSLFHLLSLVLHGAKYVKGPITLNVEFERIIRAELEPQSQPPNSLTWSHSSATSTSEIELRIQMLEYQVKRLRNSNLD